MWIDSELKKYIKIKIGKYNKNYTIIALIEVKIQDIKVIA